MDYCLVDDLDASKFILVREYDEYHWVVISTGFVTCHKLTPHDGSGSGAGWYNHTRD